MDKDMEKKGAGRGGKEEEEEELSGG